MEGGFHALVKKEEDQSSVAPHQVGAPTLKPCLCQLRVTRLFRLAITTKAGQVLETSREWQ